MLNIYDDYSMNEKQEATLNFVLFWLSAIGFFACMYFEFSGYTPMYLTVIGFVSGIVFLTELFVVITNVIIIHHLESIKYKRDKKNDLVYRLFYEEQ